jgi:glyoxylase-like metal-dependent hydrolase (beta-lactamase superfamily II)
LSLASDPPRYGPVPVEEVSAGVLRVLAPNPGVMTGPGTNTYLVGDEELAVIDPGPDDPSHIERLVELGRGRIKWILVTHTHPDHAPGARELARRTGAPTVGFGSRDGFEAAISAGDGYSVKVSGRPIRALHTPGHASNHLCWLLEDAGILFSGDHIMQGSTVVVAPPDGDMAAYLASLRRLQDMAGSITAIAPGHGHAITDPAGCISGYISHRLERERAVIAAIEDTGEATVDELLPRVYADVVPALHPIARWSLWAHLLKLAGDELVSSRDPSDIEARWYWSG